jgi:N-acetylneuraminate synthase
MRIFNRTISEKKPPFIVAEISANHNNNLQRTLKLVDEAKKAGADAVKIQTYKADTITLNSRKKDFLINDKKSLWHGKYLYELYQKGSTPWEWHKEIFERAKKNRILCFSSPFDETAVDFLKKFKPPVYKVASFENNHEPLIKKIITTNKPIIVSLGLTKLKDIKNLVSIFKKNKYKNFALLKCTSAYPSKLEESNLRTILDLKKKFQVEIGLSDHTPGIGAAIAAIAYGATIIEKHFTLNKKAGGFDDIFSIEPHELSSLVSESRRAWLSLGKVFYNYTKSEKRHSIFKRSIYTSKDIKKGDFFTEKNIKIVRPNKGLHPKYYFKILRKKSLKNLEYATPIKKNFIKFD